MSKGSKQWRCDQERDHYVNKARAENYRSRAVYKLQEMDARYQLIKPGHIVCDLGAAPGSWSQYAAARCGAQGSVIAVDLLNMEAINNVAFIHGDFSEKAVLLSCMTAVDNRPVDLVMSDMAPNLTGIKDTDQARSLYLAELVLAFATDTLKHNGKCVVKLFQGAGIDVCRKEIAQYFQRVISYKPKASRSQSRELYILASGYKV